MRGEKLSPRGPEQAPKIVMVTESNQRKMQLNQLLVLLAEQSKPLDIFSTNANYLGARWC
jgi:hypothetical protein